MPATAALGGSARGADRVLATMASLARADFGTGHNSLNDSPPNFSLVILDKRQAFHGKREEGRNIWVRIQRSVLRGGTNFMKQPATFRLCNRRVKKRQVVRSRRSHGATAAFMGCFVTVCLAFGTVSLTAQVNVTQEHNHLSRDGLYIDPVFTAANAANLTRDLGFDGTISGNVYAQPLYIEGGPDGPVVIAVTESNNVYALDANDGSIVWQRNLGPAVSSGLPCGNIDPLGISGTPAVDLASRSLFIDAMIDGPTKKHFVYSLNVDTGATNSGWPVDLNATAAFNDITFTSLVENERGGLAVVNGVVYISFSGHAGDCGTYHGWVVGIHVNDPSVVIAWATDAIGGGIWGHGGVASDGTNMFVVTGNTFNTNQVWGGGEAVIRLQPGPIFSDYWAPTNWFNLDQGDTDLGGVSATLVDVPGATPSQLVLALGKDSKAYLLNRNSLGGISAPVASANLPSAVRG